MTLIKPSRRVSTQFANLGIDQAHEQNNKILKTDGGIIGILDNPTALLEWTISGPVISEIVSNEENDFWLNFTMKTQDVTKKISVKIEKHSLLQCWNTVTLLEKQKRTLCI